MKIKLFTLAIILINYSTMIAKEQSFYSGTIVGAQYSKMKPEIKNLDYYESLVGKGKVTRKSIKNTKIYDLAYLAISVKMEYGRSLSTHDYFVIGNGIPYACAAIQIGALPFDASYQEIDISNPEKIYTLLFVVDYYYPKFNLIFRHAFDGKNQKKIIVKAERLRGALTNLSGEKAPVAEVAKPEPVIAKPAVAEVAKPEPVVVAVKVELLDINKATTEELKNIGVSGFIAGEIVSKRSEGQYSDMQSLLDRFSDVASCQPILKKLEGKLIFNVTKTESSTSNSDGKINLNTATRDEMRSLKISGNNEILKGKKAGLKFNNFNDFISKMRIWKKKSLEDFAKSKNKDADYIEKGMKRFEGSVKKWEKQKDMFIFE